MKKRHTYFTQRRRYRLVMAIRRMPWPQRKFAFLERKMQLLHHRIWQSLILDSLGKIVRFPLNRGGKPIRIYNVRKLAKMEQP